MGADADKMSTDTINLILSNPKKEDNCETETLYEADACPWLDTQKPHNKHLIYFKKRVQPDYRRAAVRLPLGRSSEEIATTGGSSGSLATLRRKFNKKQRAPVASKDIISSEMDVSYLILFLKFVQNR